MPPQLLGQFRAVDQHAHLGVEDGRARVEVHRADVDPAPVDQHRLAVQACARRTGHAELSATFGARRLAFHLVEFDAAAGQLPAHARVPGVDCSHVRGGKRIGQHGDAQPPFHVPHQGRGALLARHEIRRNDEHFALREIDRGLEPGEHTGPVATAVAAHLARFVDQQLDLPYVQRRGRRQQPFRAVFHASQRLHVGCLRRVLVVLLRARDQRLELSGLRPAEVEARDRHRAGAVPVIVELPAHVGHDRAGQRDVQVREVRVRGGAEIFVADVPAADDRDAVVGDPRLVVHAMVQPARAQQPLAGPAEQARATVEWIEQPHLDVGVQVGHGQALVLVARIEVVDQDANAHAALGGAQQLAGQQPPGEVLVPDVVLRVQRAFGRRRGRRAVGVGLGVVLDQADARGYRVRPELADHGAIERRGGGRRHRVRSDDAVQPRRARAVRKQRQHRDERQRSQPPHHGAAPASPADGTDVAAFTPNQRSTLSTR